MENKTTFPRPSTDKTPWVEITIETHQHLQDALANFLIELGSNGVVVDEEIANSLYGDIKKRYKDYRCLRAYFKNDSNLDYKLQALQHYLISLTQLHFLHSPPTLKLYLVQDDDWDTKWRSFFTTTRIGTHLIIKPSWELYLPQERDIVIEMDPGMAFGTGTHPTTRMCLRAIEQLVLEGGNNIHTMLDVGTGSGILSIAAAKLGVKKILGIDIDPVALRYAEQNVEKNGVSDRVEVQSIPLKNLKGTFNLVAANLLSEVIIALSHDLSHHLKERGILLLSGIMVEEERKVIKKFTSKKLSLLHTYYDTGWVCIMLQKIYSQMPP